MFFVNKFLRRLFDVFKTFYVPILAFMLGRLKMPLKDEAILRLMRLGAIESE